MTPHAALAQHPAVTAHAAALRAQTEYPFFMRSIGSDQQKLKSMARACAYWGWQQVSAMALNGALRCGKLSGDP